MFSMYSLLGKHFKDVMSGMGSDYNKLQVIINAGIRNNATAERDSLLGTIRGKERLLSESNKFYDLEIKRLSGLSDAERKAQEEKQDSLKKIMGVESALYEKLAGYNKQKQELERTISDERLSLQKKIADAEATLSDKIISYKNQEQERETNQHTR